MLTIFTIPKAFHGHFGIIQRNAIASWTQLSPRVEVILLGSDEGTDEAARRFGIRHIPEVAKNEHGTPLLNDIFRKAESASSSPWMCYVNADVILRNDFLEALGQAQKRLARFLFITKRVNFEIAEELDFAADWKAELERRIRATGEDGSHTAIDAFAFPRGIYADMPDFYIGRLWFDHWMIKAALRMELPVVDASLVAPVFHQNHEYGHVAGGYDRVWKGEEAAHNLQLYGGVRHAYTMLDATHELTPDGKLRRVPFRKAIFQAKQMAWDLFIRRTAKVRRALGLRRHTERQEVVK